MPQSAFQAGLFSGGRPRVDAGSDRKIVQLDELSWVVHGRGFLVGADQLFLQLRESLEWQSSRRWMYDREVAVPRLTANVSEEDASRFSIIEEMRQLVCRDYEADLKGAFAALYRDGSDSVAWHSDRVDLSYAAHVSAIVSLGGPRKFLLRPKGRGPSRPYWLESGDLLVLGGAIQHRWEHCVPKVRHALPRIALLFFGADRSLPPGIRRSPHPQSASSSSRASHASFSSSKQRS